MNTIKNNTLIAQFMGWQLSGVPNLINEPATREMVHLLNVKGTEKELVNGKYKLHRLNELEFHLSWNWLMPVLNNIYTINAKLDFESEQYETYEEMFNIDATFYEFLQNDLSSIYERCVEFIKWYNKQTK